MESDAHNPAATAQLALRDPRLLESLPVELVHLVLDYLSPADITWLSMASRTLEEMVVAYAHSSRPGGIALHKARTLASRVREVESLLAQLPELVAAANPVVAKALAESRKAGDEHVTAQLEQVRDQLGSSLTVMRGSDRRDPLTWCDVLSRLSALLGACAYSGLQSGPESAPSILVRHLDELIGSLSSLTEDSLGAAEPDAPYVEYIRSGADHGWMLDGPRDRSDFE